MIQDILLQHQQTIESMEIPDLVNYDPDYIPVISPHLNKLRLKQIKNEVLLLKKHNQGASRANYDPQLINQLLNLVIDEKIFVNNKLVQRFDRQFIREEVVVPVEEAEVVEEDEESLDSLRKRLLSGGTHTQMLDSATNKQNEYNESIQSSVLTELLDLTKVLKDSSVKFAHKLTSDTLILEQTGDNLLKNSTLFNTVNDNLSNYVENKTGYKIGLFFLIKATAGTIAVFLLMVLITKVLPNI